MGIAACGGKSSPSPGSRQLAACANMADSAIATAALVYTKQVSPPAQRFLVPIGTDSALPQAAIDALTQDRGPTYYYPSSPAQWPALRDKLTGVGPWNALLVSRSHLAVDSAAGTVAIELHGHYLLGPEQGQTAAPQRYDVRCDSTGWHATAIKGA